jgi:DegV family protein with EDD domain
LKPLLLAIFPPGVRSSAGDSLFDDGSGIERLSAEICLRRVMSSRANHVAIITDSTCDIPTALAAAHNIIVIPQYLVWGAEELRDGLDIDNAGFFTRLSRDPVHPKTSQPTPSDFAELIRGSGAREAVIITISRQLSGTFDSAHAAQDLVALPLYVVDSSSVSIGLGWQVLAAARVRDQGGSIGDIIAAVEHMRRRIGRFFFTVDTLEFLNRGGRVGGAATIVGTALQLKPMLVLDHSTGRVESGDRTRTRARALRRIIDATFEQADMSRPLHIAVMHGAAPEDARLLIEEVRARCEPVELLTGEVSPIIGVHAGPGVIGVGAYND